MPIGALRGSWGWIPPSRILGRFGLDAMWYLLAVVCSDLRNLCSQSVLSFELLSGDKKNEAEEKRAQERWRLARGSWASLRFAPLLSCRADMNNK